LHDTLILRLHSWIGPAEAHARLQQAAGHLFWPQIVRKEFRDWGWHARRWFARRRKHGGDATYWIRDCSRRSAARVVLFSVVWLTLDCPVLFVAALQWQVSVQGLGFFGHQRSA
jgi:hypothetical protein